MPYIKELEKMGIFIKRCWHSRRRFLPFGVLILFLFLSSILYQLAFGYRLPKYTESAHGNISHGVNRTGLKTPINFGYSAGNCTHCHEQHGSIGGSEPNPSVDAPNNYMLFAEPNVTSQDNNFCFQCHQGVGSVQYGSIPNPNNDYGSQFGGGTANSTNIKDAFYFGKPLRTWNDGSSHNLGHVQTLPMTQTWGTWITSNTNACVVCHDPHYAQKNHDPYPTPPLYKTAIRKPEDPGSIQNRPRNLWGDEANSGLEEIMSEYAIPQKYQAPYRIGKANYEPGGQLTDGSNLPNFVMFCDNCHTDAIPNNRTDANIGSRSSLYDTKWGSLGNIHGKKAGAPSSPSINGGHLIAPYTQPDSVNYVLSCTDCHEPHGSPNPFLLRTCVNGKDNIQVKICSTVACQLQGQNNWNYLNLYEFCSACHDVAVGTGTVHRFIDDTNKYTSDCMQNGGCHTHSNVKIF